MGRIADSGGFAEPNCFTTGTFQKAVRMLLER